MSIYIYIYIYTKILEVNLFAFAYRLFRRDFSPLDGTYCIVEIVLYIYIYIYIGWGAIYIYIGWIALFVGRSLFALYIAHCSQFEHSGDFTMQSKQCVNVLPVSQVQESP